MKKFCLFLICICGLVKAFAENYPDRFSYIEENNNNNLSFEKLSLNDYLSYDDTSNEKDMIIYKISKNTKITLIQIPKRKNSLALSRVFVFDNPQKLVISFYNTNQIGQNNGSYLHLYLLDGAKGTFSYMFSCKDNFMIDRNLRYMITFWHEKTDSSVWERYHTETEYYEFKIYDIENNKLLKPITWALNFSLYNFYLLRPKDINYDFGIMLSDDSNITASAVYNVEKEQLDILFDKTYGHQADADIYKPSLAERAFEQFSD